MMGGSHWFGFRFLTKASMVLKINKSDFERIVQALVLASKSETNANKSDKYTLTRKKIKRQAKK